MPTKTIAPSKPEVIKTDYLALTLASLKRARSVTKHLNSFIVFLLIAAAVTAAEVTLMYKPLAGVYVNAITLAFLIGLSLISDKARKLAICVAILPVANMVVLSMPNAGYFNHKIPFIQSIIYYDTILLLALVYRFMFTIDEEVKQTKIGIKNYAYVIPLVIIIGQVLGVIGYGMLRNNYPFYTVSLPLIAFCAVVFGFCEEILFRGLIQYHARKTLGTVMAVILSTGLFALVNISRASILSFLFALIAGFSLAITYAIKQNIVLTTAMNVSYKLAFIALMASFTFH